MPIHTPGWFEPTPAVRWNKFYRGKHNKTSRRLRTGSQPTMVRSSRKAHDVISAIGRTKTTALATSARWNFMWPSPQIPPALETGLKPLF